MVQITMSRVAVHGERERDGERPLKQRVVAARLDVQEHRQHAAPSIHRRFERLEDVDRGWVPPGCHHHAVRLMNRDEQGDDQG